MLRLPHNCTNLHASKEMLQILQFRLQQCVNQELSYVQAAFRKSWGTRDQNYQHPLDHRKSKRIPEKRYQFSSAAQSCPTLSNLMNHSMLGLPVHHQLLESPTPGVHPNPCPLCWWCHPNISSSVIPSVHPPTLNVSQHQGLFKWVSSSHQVAKVLEFRLQHQSFQWTPRTDLL